MNGEITAITGLILVGGKSRRMGRDKAFLEIDGIPLFERVLRAVSSVFDSVLLIGDQRERYAGYRLPIIGDRYPGSALGGLYTGLLSAPTDLVFVAPCDMPFPSPSLIRFICSLADGFDAVVPRTRNGFEPLFALYRKSCLGAMQRLLEEGNFCVYDFYPDIAVRYVSEEEISRAAQGDGSLVNVNTPEEFAAIKE